MPLYSRWHVPSHEKGSREQKPDCEQQSPGAQKPMPVPHAFDVVAAKLDPTATASRDSRGTRGDDR